MPRNLTGGSNHRSRKNHAIVPVRKIDEISKSDENQIYGQVISALGDRRFKVRCKKPDQEDYIELICKLKGSIPRSKRVVKETYVLINLPEYNDKTGYIVEVYDESEVRQMKKRGLWNYENQEVHQEFTEDGDEVLPIIDESADPFTKGTNTTTTVDQIDDLDIQNI